jgi:PAS domain S-box-containing protein
MKLQERLAGFRPLLERSSDLITLVDPNGAVVYASPAHNHVLGYAPEEIQGTNLLDYVHADDVGKAEAALADVISEPEDAPSFEVRVRHRDGSYRWLLSTLTNQLDNPSLESIVLNCRHITERKDVQDALSWESDLNSAIAELAQAMISSVSLESISRMVLKEAQKLTGSAFGFVGYIDPETRHMVIASMTREVWEQCGVEEQSVEFQSFGGLWGWALEHQRPLMVNDVENDSRSGGLPQGHVPIRRFLVAPALIGGTLMGQVALANARRPYTRRDLAAVKRFASLYAIAVEAQRSRTTLHRYAEEQSALYTIGAAVASLRTPEAVMDTVIEAVGSTLGAEAGWINVSRDNESEKPGSVSGYGIPEETKREMASVGICPILKAGTPDNDDALDDGIVARCEHIRPRSVHRDFDYWACIPIIVGGRLIASLSLLWKQSGPMASNRSLLQAVGRQVGVALENARLYREAQQADQLRVLNALDRALQATLNPGEIARVTLEHATRALDTSGGTFLSCKNRDSICFNVQLSQNQIWQKSALTEKEVELLKELAAWLQNHEETGPILIGQLPASLIEHLTNAIDQWSADDMIAPLTSELGIGGLLVLNTRSDGRLFSVEDRALVRAVANRASQMLRNAQLYQASMDQTERLRTLNRISSFAAASLEPGEILDRILTLAGQAFDVEEGSILLRVMNNEAEVTDSHQSENGEIAFKAVLEHESLIGRRIPETQGVAGWTVRHNQSLIVNDAQTDQRFYSGIDAVTDFKTRSILCVPLRVQNRAIGAIEMINKRDGAFGKDDLDLLEAVAAIASVALDNARLYTRTRDRAEELSVLNQFSRVLASTLDSERLTKAALDQITELFWADGVALMKLDKDMKVMHLAQGRFQGVYQKPPLSIPVGEGVTGWVYTEQKPILITDAQREARLFVEANVQIRPRPRAMMAVPLIVQQDRVMGVLLVASQEAGIYDEEDLQTLQALASTLAVALENARLYEDLQVLLEERERTQAMMIHTEKMAALGRLVASLAHEINNPLQAVLGCLTLAREELEESPDPNYGNGEISSYIDIAEGEIDRISEIVHRMRDFYRPTRNGTQRTDIHEILEKVLELSATQLERNEVGVRRDWEANLPEIYVTPDHLMQVFLNLLLNAVDAMPDGGVLTIRTRWREDDPKRMPGVCIEFEDTGIGIEPEVLSRIFEPFFTTKPKGSGLGLSITYSIIQAHDGEIRVSSHPGEGTIFTLLLPFGDIKERELP